MGASEHRGRGGVQVAPAARSPRANDGEAGDVLVRLRCHDGMVEATGSDGRRVPLTESGCPSDFHVQLLLELARVSLDDRRVVIISPEGTAERAKWTRAIADDLVGAREPGVEHR